MGSVLVPTAPQIFLMMTKFAMQIASVMSWSRSMMQAMTMHVISAAVLSPVLGLGVGSSVGVVVGVVGAVVLMLHVWSVWAQLSSRLGISTMG